MNEREQICDESIDIDKIINGIPEGIDKRSLGYGITIAIDIIYTLDNESRYRNNPNILHDGLNKLRMVASELSYPGLFNAIRGVKQ